MFNGRRGGVIFRIPLPRNLRRYWFRFWCAVAPFLYFLVLFYDMFMLLMLYRFKCFCAYFFVRAIRRQVTSIPVPEEVEEHEAGHLMYFDR
ncbi:hypothetical protein CAEBREN_14077 [Caenorhabditis brenneri]|uniref:Uncharacterized protein n=1 Tax=Caenorhabditis brenneri TaxID=135651 RepID=G0MTH9_CAEBE|nr:hypothetical protein CAEBREN_14077 [Caenorhabditis brenneri]